MCWSKYRPKGSNLKKIMSPRLIHVLLELVSVLPWVNILLKTGFWAHQWFVKVKIFPGKLFETIFLLLHKNLATPDMPKDTFKKIGLPLSFYYSSFLKCPLPLGDVAVVDVAAAVVDDVCHLFQYSQSSLHLSLDFFCWSAFAWLAGLLHPRGQSMTNVFLPGGLAVKR